jgi:hypothetical protein
MMDRREVLREYDQQVRQNPVAVGVSPANATTPTAVLGSHRSCAMTTPYLHPGGTGSVTR